MHFLFRSRVCLTSLRLFFVLLAVNVSAQTDQRQVSNSKQALDIIERAAALLGGDRYLNVRSQVGKGKFSVIRNGTLVSFQTFVDIIVFPNRERTDFKSRSSKITQVNTGETGWIFDGDQEIIRDQTEIQIANFKRGLRTSLDNLLRGFWKGDAELTYIGKRPASLGKRNEAIRLTYSDGFVVEFEFSADDGYPQKAIYSRKNIDGEEVMEEDRYAQFIEVKGIRSPFVIDRYSDGKHASRINFESIEFDRRISDSIFEKPADIKTAKKNIKY